MSNSYKLEYIDIFKTEVMDIKKLYNAIKILQLLKYRGKMTCNEIAEELNLGPRQVRRIIEELDGADGIYIERHRGKYGGYELTAYSFLSDFGIDTSEMMALETARHYLSETKGYYLEKEYDLAIEKIKTSVKRNANKPKVSSVLRTTNSRYDVEKKYVPIIQDAISNRKKIEILYYSIGKNQYTYRIVHPYVIYNYDSFLYIAAFCENNEDFRDFKIIRIKDIKVLTDNYSLKKFDFKKYMNKTFGIFKDDNISIKLKIKHPYNVYVKETLFIEGQTITEIDNETILFEATMQGKPEILTWIKGMGSYAEVIEPKEIRDKIIEDINKTRDIYL